MTGQRALGGGACLEREESYHFYATGQPLLIEFDEVGRVHLVSWFPGVVAFWISLPFDQIVELF
jgi:hypothetical protein